jgi:RNA polymerase sigma-70 factor (ECF subfamily)
MRVGVGQSPMTRVASSLHVGFELEAALLACAAGDEAALKKIYEKEAPRLLRVAYCIVGRRDLAEDVVQEAFLQIWREARSFDPNRGSARGWIYSLVRKRALKSRRAVLDESTVQDGALLAVLNGDTDPTSRLPAECALRRALESLDPKRRASLILAYVHGCTDREIARQLGVSLTTAKTWIRRSLIAVWKHLSIV